MMKDMTKGSEIKHIINFAVPMLLGNLFQQFYNMVDMMVVGKFVGANALASVSTSFPIMFLMIAMVMGLTMGGGVVISQYYGAQQMDVVKRSVSTLLYVTVAGAVVITILGMLLLTPLMMLMQVPPELRGDVRTYLYIIFAGSIAMFLYNGLSAIFRSLGDSKTPLYFLIISSLVNVALDIYFVVSLDMRVAGVALATVISQVVSVLLFLVYIRWKKITMMEFSKGEFVFDRSIFGMMLKMGLPTVFQQMVLSMGFIFVQGLVNSFGAAATAAVGTASRIEQIADMPSMNIGMALSTFTGQNIGAGRIDRVQRGFGKTLLVVAGFSVVTSCIVYLLGPWLIQAFVSESDAAVINLGTQYLQVVAYFLVLFALMATTNGLLRGAGDVNVSAFSTFITFGARLAAGYGLKFFFPAVGVGAVWWSLPVGWFIGMAIALGRYFMGVWKKKAIVTIGGKEQSKAADPVLDEPEKILSTCEDLADLPAKEENL